MFKFSFLCLISFLSASISPVSAANSKNNNAAQILEIQTLINEAYEKKYVDAAPVEMRFIEKKVVEAKTANEKRKKKVFQKLIDQIKADLKIVKKRYEVNQLHKKLAQAQQKNQNYQKQLDELKRQL